MADACGWKESIDELDEGGDASEVIGVELLELLDGGALHEDVVPSWSAFCFAREVRCEGVGLVELLKGASRGERQVAALLHRDEP